MGQEGNIKALKKAVDILLKISEMKESASLDEITRLTELKKTTCFRLLKSMCELNLIEKVDATKKYRLGPLVISLGLAALSQLDLYKVAYPLMKKLRDDTEETVNLSIVDNAEILFIERLPSRHLVNINLGVGSRLPVHLTSQGKAIMAFLPEEKFDRLIEQINAKYDGDPINIESLRMQLGDIRERKYVHSDGELEKGLCAVAAPILNHNGHAIAAINVSYSKMRHPEKEYVLNLVKMVSEVSRKISKSMGYV